MWEKAQPADSSIPIILQEGKGRIEGTKCVISAFKGEKICLQVNGSLKNPICSGVVEQMIQGTETGRDVGGCRVGNVDLMCLAFL